MKTISLLILCCLSAMSFAQDRPAIPNALEMSAMNIVTRLIATDFPELKSVNITPKSIQNDAVFLATDIEIPSLLSGEREYVLYLNKKLLENPISDLALEGILAHELSHFSDYEKMNTFELAVFYARILSDGEFEARYERATDLQAFERGHAIGIKAFRFWLYEQIDEQAKTLKEKNYYTPAQIDTWLLDQSDITLL